MKVFPKPSRNDPGQTLMAVRKVNRKHPLRQQPLPFHKFFCLHLALSCHLFPAYVQRDQFRRGLCRLTLVLGKQQFERPFCRIKPPAGIDTGSEHKADMIRRQILVGKTALQDQGTHPQVFGPHQCLQPFPYDRTVFSVQIHHVTDGGKSGIFVECIRL